MKKTFLLFLLACISIVSYSQGRNSKVQQDSIKNETLQQQSNELKKLQIQREADSVKRTELQQRVDQLKSTDNQQKEELQRQINDLNNKETQRIEKEKQKIDSLRTFVSGFPVSPFNDNDTLFLIYNKVGSFTPAERAASVSDRIRKLAKSTPFYTDSIKVSASDQGFDIVYDENIIMSITQADALWQHSTSKELSDQYREVIGKAITNYKKSVSFITILKQIGLALLVLIVLAAIIYYLGKLFHWTAVKIRRQKGKLLKGYKIRNYHLLDAGRQVAFLLVVNTIVKWLIIVFVISLTLPLLFSIFPWTKNFANTLLDYVLTPLKVTFNKIWDYLPKLVTIIVIVALFHYLIKGIRFLKKEVERGELKIEGFYPDWANPTFQIIRVLLFAFMIVVIFPYLPGSDSPVFKGVSVFSGNIIYVRFCRTFIQFNCRFRDHLHAFIQDRRPCEDRRGNGRYYFQIITGNAYPHYQE